MSMIPEMPKPKKAKPAPRAPKLPAAPAVRDSMSTDQRKALDGIVTLFSSEKPQIATLAGAAGTGKTYLCDALANSFTPTLCAMTNKAAAVLAEHTDRDVVTLAKVLKKRKFEDTNTGKVAFNSTRDVELAGGVDTLIVDEVSMMQEYDYTQVLSAIAPHYNVLLVGDKYQLPPVHEEQSLAFTAPANIHHLNTPHRFAADSGINATSLTVRTALERGERQIHGMREVLKQYDDVLWLPEAKAVPMMIEAFKRAEEVDDVRLISFTNQRVDTFNYHLKRAVTGDTDKIKDGDLLMANAAYSIEQQNDDGYREDVVVINNNQTVRVVRVKMTKYQGIDAYEMIVSGTGTGLLEVLVPVHQLMLDREVSALRSEALSYTAGSDERRSTFREMFDLINKFADLRLSYAQTVHKSQGSTYEYCFFDLHKLNKDTVMGKKLLYTGVTRAAKQLVLFK